MSALKRTALRIAVCLIVVIAVGSSLVQFFHRNDMRSVVLVSGKKRFILQVAATLTEQQKGLGGRPSLAQNQGMLFSFGKASVHCFWMKDMHFPLDMIWVGSNKQALSVQSGVSPDTYPRTLCPNVPAKYVIELNDGQAAQAGIHTGETLTF